jgi:hypothetical protein
MENSVHRTELIQRQVKCDFKIVLQMDFFFDFLNISDMKWRQFDFFRKTEAEKTTPKPFFNDSDCSHAINTQHT